MHSGEIMEPLPLYQEHEKLKIIDKRISLNIVVNIRDSNSYEHSVILDDDILEGLILENVVLYKNRKRYHITRNKEYAQICANRNMVKNL